MTTKEFENLANKLQSVKVNLWAKKDLKLWFFLRREKNKCDFLDVTLFVGNKINPRKYPYKFFKTDSLSEAKTKFEDINKHILNVA